MSRGKALRYNIIATMASELVTLISGLIMPRIILLYFGSATNGLVSSVSHFLGFSVILRAGLGGAVRVALYKPLAEKNLDDISSVMAATSSYMKKLAVITGAFILAFAFIYPLWVIDEYSYLYAFIMVLVIGVGTIADSFWGVKCKILLQADQKYYIPIVAATISHIMVTIASMVVIIAGCSVTQMKVVAVFVALINPLILNIYVKKKYDINWKAKPNDHAIKQRWHSFFQQLAVIVNQNVDLVLLTAMVSLKEVSVYTIHYLVVSNIGKIVNSCTTGINSTFGDLAARNENEKLKSSFLFFEWLVFALGTVLYAITSVMISSFINLYTTSVDDVNYVRPIFGLVMTLAVFTNTLKSPYQLLCEGLGRFKETQSGAVAEVVLNIVLSIVFVKFFGVVGVLIGTFCSAIFRMIYNARYAAKHIFEIKWSHFVKHFVLVVLTFMGCYMIGTKLISNTITNYYQWCLNSVFVGIICIAVVLAVSLVFYKDQVLFLSKKFFKK